MHIPTKKLLTPEQLIASAFRHVNFNKRKNANHLTYK